MRTFLSLRFLALVVILVAALVAPAAAPAAEPPPFDPPPSSAPLIEPAPAEPMAVGSLGQSWATLSGTGSFLKPAAITTNYLVDPTGCLASLVAGTWTADLRVPDGSTLNSFVVNYFDDDAALSGTISLVRHTFGSGTDTLATLTLAPGGGAASWRVASTALSDVVDMGTASYEFRWNAPALGGGTDRQWLCGVKVNYTPVGYPAMLSTPARVVDTRNASGFQGAGQHMAGYGSGFAKCFILAGGTNPIPAGARAAIVNLTATNIPTAGYLTMYPNGAAYPATSSLNFVTSENPAIANGAIVNIGTSEKVCVAGAAGADVIIDVVGYITGP